MVEPPNQRVDPAAEFASAATAVIAAVRRLVTFFPVFLYFFVYWRTKDSMRLWLRTGALGVLSVTLLLFIFEVILKFAGHHVIEEVRTKYPAYDIVVLGLFVIAGAIILRHNVVEASNRHTEAAISSGLWRLFYCLPTLDRQELTKNVLSIVTDVFKHFGGCSACIWTPEEEGLSIKQGHWHPGSIPDGYICRLHDNCGIAGLVFADRSPRYVPRLFFPFNSPSLRWASIRFPHALMFSIVNSPDGVVDVDPKQPLSTNAVHFEASNSADALMSFVAVPLAASSVGKGHGVLCINFSGTNSLDTLAVKLASVLGVVIAEKLDRLESVTVHRTPMQVPDNVNIERTS